MKNVDFSHVLEYYVNLENSAITPILLTVVENLVGESNGFIKEGYSDSSSASISSYLYYSFYDK